MDFFIDDVANDQAAKNLDLASKVKSHKATPAPAVAAPAGNDVTASMNGLKGVITPDLVEKVKGVYTFNITDATPAEWYLDLKNGSGNLAAGKFDGNSDVNLTMNSDVFLKLTNGSLKATNAFMTGKLKIKGKII